MTYLCCQRLKFTNFAKQGLALHGTIVHCVVQMTDFPTIKWHGPGIKQMLNIEIMSVQLAKTDSSDCTRDTDDKAACAQ